MSSAQRDISEENQDFAPAALKQQAADRLAAHRSRRARGPEAGSQTLSPKVASSGAPRVGRASQVAAAVAARYERSQTYREFLETETRHAPLHESSVEAGSARSSSAVPEVRVPKASIAPAEESSAVGFTVRLYEDAGSPQKTGRRTGSLRDANEAGTLQNLGADSEESRVLDEEIAYRQSATVDLEHPGIAIPGNLLEFPRHLVATRKARPRYAEGPLREDQDASNDGTQLRIFEVEATQIASAPAVDSSAPEWSSIWLDALAKPVHEEAQESAQVPFALRPQPAAMQLRLMATIVDLCAVSTGYLLFACLFVYSTPALPSLATALIASVGTFAGLFLLYQALFFTFGEATPGMRYARIGLCTFGDDNPTRAAMRRRILASVLAVCPLGLGLLWACLDDDRLGWHDRISRMYQREY